MGMVNSGNEIEMERDGEKTVIHVLKEVRSEGVRERYNLRYRVRERY